MSARVLGMHLEDFICFVMRRGVRSGLTENGAIFKLYHAPSIRVIISSNSNIFHLPQNRNARLMRAGFKRMHDKSTTRFITGAAFTLHVLFKVSKRETRLERMRDGKPNSFVIRSDLWLKRLHLTARGQHASTSELRW